MWIFLATSTFKWIPEQEPNQFQDRKTWKASNIYGFNIRGLGNHLSLINILIDKCLAIINILCSKWMFLTTSIFKWIPEQEK